MITAVTITFASSINSKAVILPTLKPESFTGIPFEKPEIESVTKCMENFFVKYPLSTPRNISRTHHTRQRNKHKQAGLYLQPPEPGISIFPLSHTL